MRTTKKQRAWITIHNVLLKLHRWYDAGLVKASSVEELATDRLTEGVTRKEREARAAMCHERERQIVRQLCGHRNREPRGVQIRELEYPPDFPVSDLNALIRSEKKRIS